LPTKSHGGQPAGYTHSMNSRARELRRASVNRAIDVEQILVTAGIGAPTSGPVLG
jgi:hypothetical protein